MKTIPLTQGKVAVIDDDDLELVSKYNWYYLPNGYAANKTKKTIYMHRLIAGTPDDMETDHINGDKLDNRRCNLRICTKQDNMRNRDKQNNNTTGYKGVYKTTGSEKWRAQIVINRKAKHLGLFDTREEAAQAYREAEKKYFGEFSNRMKSI